MTLKVAYLAAAAALLMVGVAPIAALVVSAPDATEPSPTAFYGGSDNLTAFASGLREAGYDVQGLVTSTGLLDGIDDPGHALLVIVAPTRPPTDLETRRLDAFLGRGGRVLVADGEGTMNRFLAGYGASATDKRLVGSADPPAEVSLLPRNLTDVALPVAAVNAGRLYFEEQQDWVGVLEAPASVHLDIDGDGRIGRADTPGPHAVAARLTLESGGILVVAADSSFLRDREITNASNGNLVFARSIIGSMLDHGVVVFDESGNGLAEREPYVAPLVAWSVAFHDVSAVAWVGLVILLAGSVLLAALFGPSWRPFRPHRFHIPVDRAPPPRPVAIIPDPDPLMEQINEGEQE